MNVKYTILFLFLFSLTCKSDGNIVPGIKWTDTDGDVINAHGGGLIEDHGKYYWFGEKRNARGLINKVNVYSSQDLVHWKNNGIALDLSHMKIRHDLERPKVIYSPKINKYVMWMHIELNGHYSTGKAGVAISDTITGPYKFYKEYWPNPGIKPIKRDGDLKYKNTQDADKSFSLYFKRGQMFRDMNTFIDNNGKAYIVYESEDDLSLQIAELTSDYLGFSGRYSRVLVGGRNEAPALFKKNNEYYLITSGLRGFSPNDARISVSDNIFGPWKLKGNPARSSDRDLVNKTFYSQSTDVLQVNGEYIFLADRWNEKDLSNSSYVWLPISWQKNIPFIEWRDKWMPSKYLAIK